MSALEINGMTWGNGPEHPLFDAVDAASAQGRITWLTVNGKRLAAIVPVSVVAEAVEAASGLTGNPAFHG